MKANNQTQQHIIKSTKIQESRLTYHVTKIVSTLNVMNPKLLQLIGLETRVTDVKPKVKKLYQLLC